MIRRLICAGLGHSHIARGGDCARCGERHGYDVRDNTLQTHCDVNCLHCDGAWRRLTWRDRLLAGPVPQDERGDR